MGSGSDLQQSLLSSYKQEAGILFWDLQYSPIPRHGSVAINFSSGQFPWDQSVTGIAGWAVWM